MVDTNRRDPSLSELEHESERTRAELAHTVDELRTRVSPTALKQDVKDYVRHTREELFQTVERRVRENPLQALAIAAGIAYPAWRIVRSIPAPILLIGAGLALARPGTGTSAGNGHDRAEPGLLDQAREKLGDATNAVMERAQHAGDAVRQAVSDTAEQIAGTAQKVQSAVSSQVDSVRSRVESVRSGLAQASGDTADAMRDTGESTGAALSSARQQAVQATRRAQDSLIDAIERHPLVVGGIGLCIGAMLAAAIPATRAENRLLGDSSDELKNRARDLASQGYEAAKAAAQNVYEAGKEAAEEQGLTPGAVRETLQGLGEKASTAYERAANPGGAGQASQQSSSGQPSRPGEQPQRTGPADFGAKS